MTTAVENVRVDHRRRDVFVAEQFLHGSDIITGFQQVGGEAVTERMTTDGFVDLGHFCRLLNRFSNGAFMEVMSPDLSRSRIPAE